MQWIYYLVIFSCLLWMTITDLRFQRIWIPVPMIGIVLLLICHGAFHEKVWVYLLSGVCFLGIFAAISKLTSEQIGMGDAFLIGFLGTGFGFADTFLLVYIGFLFAMAVSVILLIIKKSFNYRLPFAPFMLAACICFGVANNWFSLT